MPVASALKDVDFMRRALELASGAETRGEVPVGAVLVRDQTILAEGANRPIGAHDPTAHAEIEALRAAGRALQSYRLTDTTLYVTLEPCPMCAGAIVQARVPLVVYGCADPKAGACETLYRITSDSRLNHRAQLVRGVCAERCAAVLTDFFAAKRRAGKG